MYFGPDFAIIMYIAHKLAGIFIAGKENTMFETKPWLKFYGKVPATIDYPRVTMYEALMETVRRIPEEVAYLFFDYTATYAQFAQQIDRCANALAALGLKKGDRITISMPTTPQGIICFYAVNRLGAVASMIHPLSTAKEIAFYLNVSKSRVAMTLEMFYEKFAEVKNETPLKTIILAQIPDFLPAMAQEGWDKPHTDPDVVFWRDLMGKEYPRAPSVDMDPDDMAVILYSGGTTGTPKGIMLSNYNFISEGLQVAHWGGMIEGSSVLAIMPIFHGFGLGVCVNAAFMGGGKSILVPIFTPETVADLIRDRKPSFIVGVPTLFEALCQNPVFQQADLSCLEAAFSGADSLPRPIKEQFEETVRRQGGKVKLLEGYGLTEAVTAIMATPMNEYREGSIGVPFPDMLAKIVLQGTTKEAAIGGEGELCIHGPAVMLGYLDHPEETASTLRTHEDGRIWLHTGDIASMDTDGFFYFKLRLKRMIKSSGMNVYPAQVEAVLYQHEDVKDACVIDVPDKAQVERVKAFVVLKDAGKASPEMATALIKYCQKNLIKWSCPREIEFRDILPCTRVGKIAYSVLEQEEKERLRACGEYVGE